MHFAKDFAGASGAEAAAAAVVSSADLASIDAGRQAIIGTPPKKGQ